MVKAFTIILIVVVAALSGTGAVAAASQSSLPDQALYSVKDLDGRFCALG